MFNNLNNFNYVGIYIKKKKGITLKYFKRIVGIYYVSNKL